MNKEKLTREILKNWSIEQLVEKIMELQSEVENLYDVISGA